MQKNSLIINTHKIKLDIATLKKLEKNSHNTVNITCRVGIKCLNLLKILISCLATNLFFLYGVYASAI